MLNLLKDMVGGLEPPSGLGKDDSLNPTSIAIAIIVVAILVFIIIAALYLKAKDDRELDEVYEEIEKNQEEVKQLPAVIEKETFIEKKELTDEDVETLRKYKNLFDEGIITVEEYEKIKNQTLNVVVKEKKSGMKCPHCGGENCKIVNEVSSNGKDYDASNGCCGYICFGPIGLLCGACGEGKQIETVNYWICEDCGKKWRV